MMLFRIQAKAVDTVRPPFRLADATEGGEHAIANHQTWYSLIHANQ